MQYEPKHVFTSVKKSQNITWKVINLNPEKYNYLLLDAWILKAWCCKRLDLDLDKFVMKIKRCDDVERDETELMEEPDDEGDEIDPGRVDIQG